MLDRLIGNVGLGDIPWLIVVSYVSYYFAHLSHELGHYVAIRLNNIRPLELEVGQYVTIYARNHVGTRFTLRLIQNPLGDSRVSIKGEDAARLRYYGAICILSAGIAVNILLGSCMAVFGFWLESLPLLVAALMSIASGLGQVAGGDGQSIYRVVRYREL